ncbi:MAG: hypothetical protein HC898_01505 [Phycisphaerales bacterium]|nr:hypothetical protein [Phycisphaerales bacterium]
MNSRAQSGYHGVMVKLGSIELEAPFFQAGLAGYSDTAMRLVARRHGAPYAVTEALLDVFLLQGGRGLKAAELDPADHPIAGQLMGSHPQDIARAAKVLAGTGYDVIDVNLACPVKRYVSAPGAVTCSVNQPRRWRYWMRCVRLCPNMFPAR